MILNEIQTGIGRTGHWFAYQQHHIKPDIVTSAKALGNGVPIGACMAHGMAADLFHPGNHGSTFGGNPLACAAATAVIETIENDHLLERCSTLSQNILDQFSSELENLPGVKDIRAAGLLIGIELEEDCGELVSQALENGLLINVTAGNVIRLLPPFVITDEQVTQMVTGVSKLIKNFLRQKQAA